MLAEESGSDSVNIMSAMLTQGTVKGVWSDAFEAQHHTHEPTSMEGWCSRSMQKTEV